MAIKPGAIDHVRQGGESGFGARHVVRRLFQRVIACSVLAVAVVALRSPLSSANSLHDAAEKGSTETIK